MKERKKERGEFLDRSLDYNSVVAEKKKITPRLMLAKLRVGEEWMFVSVYGS